MRRFICLALLLFILVIPTKAKPIISFFNEMKSPQLVRMFEDTTLLPTLKQLNAEIRMGMLDLTPERAGIVKKLTNAGIPVVAWLLLPEERGYWFHARNGDAAIARYIETKKWANEFGLQFKGMGLDLELDMNDVTLGKESPWKLAWTMFKRLYDKTIVEEGRKKYTALINMIRKDGYMVETYYASFVKDEVKMNNTAIQQMTGFLDVETDREIPMLYSSFIGNAEGLLTIYGKEVNAKFVGLGSTGGGVDTTLRILTYEQLVHDMNIASKFAEELHIFSLEGCVQNGYLRRLLDYKYDATLTINQNQVGWGKKTSEAFQVDVNRIEPSNNDLDRRLTDFGNCVWIIFPVYPVHYMASKPNDLLISL